MASRMFADEKKPFTVFELVIAEKNEIISGGNFHGEYPAKV